MKYEIILRCACGAEKGLLLDEEEFQEHIELKEHVESEDGLKFACSDCTWRYEKDFKELKKEAVNA